MLGVFSITVLIVIRTGLRQGVDVDRWLLRLISAMIWTTVGATLCDVLARLCDGVPGEAAHVTLVLVNSLGCLLLLAPPMLWYWATAHLSDRMPTLSRWYFGLVGAVYAVATVTVLNNLRTGVLFTIDAGNVLQRGPWYGMTYVLPYWFLFLTAIRIHRHRADYSLEVKMGLVVWLPALAAGAVQMTYCRANLVLPCMALSALWFYNELQARSHRLDYLTGVHNRRYLDALLRAKLGMKPFAVIMIDIDHFKQINDQYGHLTGDEVLMSIASLLKVAVPTIDRVARYGGDEFVVVVDSGWSEVPDSLIRRIQRALAQYNEASPHPFAVSLSIGYTIYDQRQHTTLAQLIKRVDEPMYAEKASKGQTLAMKPGY
jgi:diguanylate cyclase (GGDEF)-like protein